MKKLLAIFQKKYITYWVIGLVIVAGAGFFAFKNLRGGEETLVVHPGDFVQQVSVSGTVVATKTLDLSFEELGMVKSGYTKEVGTDC